MNWIKITEGCEMPQANEIVVAIEVIAGAKDWFECEHRGGKFIWTGHDAAYGDGEVRATHWARVEMPEEE